MIKVENDMLVLDNTFTKEDVKAIDEFVKINVDKERERIIKLLDNHCDNNHYLECECAIQLVIINGENK